MDGGEQKQQNARRERLEGGSAQLEKRLLMGSGGPKKKPEMRMPAPPDALVGRLQAFLPQLQAANADLQAQLQHAPPEAVVMERGSDDEAEGPYVEMDLACGLFDLKDEAAVAAAERAMINAGVAVERYSDSTDEDDSSSSSSSSSSGSEDAQEEDAAAARQQGSGDVAMAEGEEQLGAGGQARGVQGGQQQRRGKQRKRRPKIEEL